MNDLSEEGSRRKRRFSEEFKRDAVRLIVAEGYTFKSAATAVGVSEQSLRAWHAKFAPPPGTQPGDSHLSPTARRAADGLDIRALSMNCRTAKFTAA